MLRRMRMLRHFGHRGTVLAGFAGVAGAYGTGIVTGYRPTFSAAYHVPLTGFGWAWIGLAVFLATGAPSRHGLRHDGLHYAAAELAATAWALLLATHWSQPNGWTAAVSWAGLAAGLLVASAWPDAPRTRRPPPLPTLDELTTVPPAETGPE